jgi:urease accessory protein
MSAIRAMSILHLPPRQAAGCTASRHLAVPRARGQGRIRFARVDGATALVGAEATSPLQILTPRRRGPSAWAYLASHGGGLVSGDRVALDVEVGGGAIALIATQAETKVYRAAAGGGAEQRLTARVARGGVLALLPEPVSPFAGARHAARARFELEDGASLAVVDALVAGRSARGERWAFARHESRNEVSVGGRLVLADAVLLDPAWGGPLAARLGRFDAIAVAFALGPAFAGGARALLAQLADAPATAGAPGHPAAPAAGVVMAASPLRDGLLLRCAADSAERLSGALRAALAFAAAPLGDDPFVRRW